jgi:WD40 repeat protein
MSRDLATSSGDGDHDWRMGSSSPTDKSYGGDRDRDSRDHRDHRDSIGINIYDAMFGTSTPPTKSTEAAARTVKTGTKEYFGDPVNVTVVGGGMDDAESEFKNKTRLVQTLNFHVGAIWTLKFSPDGRFIATGGQDCKVVVWSIGLPPSVSSLNSRKESEASESEHSGDEGGRFTPRHSNFSADGHGISIGRLSSASDKAGMQPFIWPTPFRIFIGHTKDVIDVSWSKSNFVLSASADRNVRLWHVSRDECLQFFRHPDIVTSLDFHPTQDRYFVSGCMDRRLRVWDIIPDAKVKEWASLNEKVGDIPLPYYVFLSMPGLWLATTL